MSTKRGDDKQSYRATAERLRAHLAILAREHPNVWKHVDFFRSGKGKNLPDWPYWCFLPSACARAIVASKNQTGGISTIAALSAWRLTQGIYQFHPDVHAAVLDTPLDADLPGNLFFHLPEWCVYIETPGLELGDTQLHGFFCHLEYEVNTQRPELRILLDHGEVLAPYALFLNRKTIREALAAFFDAAVSASQDLEHPLNPNKKEDDFDSLKIPHLSGK